MRATDTLTAAWIAKLRELRANGHDPYNSLGSLRLGRISLRWHEERSIGAPLDATALEVRGWKLDGQLVGEVASGLKEKPNADA